MEESQFSSCVGSKGVNKNDGNRILVTEGESMNVQYLDEEDPLGIVQDNENYLTSNEAGHKNLLDSEMQISQESDAALAAAATVHSSSKDKSVVTTGTSAVKSKNVFENTTNSMEIVTRVPLDKILNLSLNNVSIEGADKQTKITKLSKKNAINYSCHQCCKVKKCLYQVDINSEDTAFICSNICLSSFKKLNNPTLQKSVPLLEASTNQILPTLNKPSLERSDPALKFERKCAECSQEIKSDNVEILSWKTMEFCKIYCLSQYQKRITSNCWNCKKPVPTDKAGQYCVVQDSRQFCSNACLNMYKKNQACSNCQKHISDAHFFLATLGNKGQLQNFCSKICMEKFTKMNLPHSAPLLFNSVVNEQKCSVCFDKKKVTIYFDEQNKNCKHAFCSDPCFVAFKFVHQINPPQCSMCKNFFNNDNLTQFTIFYNNLVHYFCCKTCQNLYIITTRIKKPCYNCTTRKFDFDMIKKSITNDLVRMFCSLNCLHCYQDDTNRASLKKLKCKFCTKISEVRYYQTMSDGTIQNFCAYSCLLSFQNQFYKLLTTAGHDEKSAPVPIKVTQVPEIANAIGSNAVMQNTSQFAPIPVKALPQLNQIESNAVKQTTSYHTILPKPSKASIIKPQIIIRDPPLPPMKNAATFCKPIMHTKSVSCCQVSDSKETQTDKMKEKINFIPVPFYIPAPFPMFSAPVPVPMPFPVPIPIPTFIPLTRNSADRIFEDLKTSQMILPNDPLESELLEMAKLIAGEEEIKTTDSEKDENGDVTDDVGLDTYDDDVLKVVNDVEELLGDIENKTANRITVPLSLDNSPVEATEKQQNIPDDNCKDKTANRISVSLSLNNCQVEATENQKNIPTDNCKDKTVNKINVPQNNDNTPIEARESQQNIPNNNDKRKKYQRTYSNLAKRRRNSTPVEIPILPLPPTQQSIPKEEPEATNAVATICPLTEGTDTNLKYDCCVNIWKDWVTEKNKLLKQSSGPEKLIKIDLLQLTERELSYYLCLFINEIKKINGCDYRPDTLYYICLGIQKYLNLNGRKYNIFTDQYFEKFTDYIDEHAKKFFEIYKNSDHISTRIEEEHLWETNQLGAHSPIVLVNTLMYFNTKYFCLSTVNEHMQLSFNQIMKHYNRTSKKEINTLLRFYPKNIELVKSTFNKFDQYENKENPLRCPVKLHDFYLKKCPKDIQTRENLFYLQPEQSCEPDSPLWYSSMALDRRTVEKTLHRLKLTKEINIALFASGK